MILNEIYIFHKDWNGLCLLNENIIYRKDIKEEFGRYILNKNKLTIKWEKWNEEDFFFLDDKTIYYYKNIFEEKYNLFYILDLNNNLLSIFLSKNDDIFIILNEDSTFKKGIYLKDNNKINLIIGNVSNSYFKFNEKIYSSIEDLNNNILFELSINMDNINNNYLFNKKSKKFFNIDNLEYEGTYNIIDNYITMKWNNGFEKILFSNKYESLNKINKNITIIKPNNIILDNKILFSNISLCKNKIILTSIHYIDDAWDFNEIEFIIKNNKINNKTILDNNNFESSLSIILELEKILPNINIKIIYKKKYIYNVYLEQLKIEDHKISAMTLFKDDYELLKKYLKYYYDLGVTIFYLYYNNNIDPNIIHNIILINKFNLNIYLVEWNYIYWYKYDNNLKHHHAQTMSINDSLNILKNYGEYTLYNDLDEYFILDNYNNFNEMIESNKEIDIFIFKNRFCKMGNKIIPYRNFEEEFDLSKIIKGNYWDNQREKNIIKLNSIEIMGVHTYYNKNKINEKIMGEFYHIINFEEKNRENLMTEYIIII